MAEKNTLSILESIKQKMMKFEQDPEKNEKIFDEIKEFEYVDPAKKELADQNKEEILQQPKVDNSKIISDNIDDEEESKFDLDLEDYEGEEDDLLQDNSNFLFEDENYVEQKEQKNNQVVKQEQKFDSPVIQQQNNQAQNPQAAGTQKSDDDFDLDELENEFLGAVSNSDTKEVQQKNNEVEEDDDFLDLDNLDDLEEKENELEKPVEVLAKQNDEIDNAKIEQDDVEEDDFLDLDDELEEKESESKAVSDVVKQEDNQIKGNEIDFANLEAKSDEEETEKQNLQENSSIDNEVDLDEDDDLEEDFLYDEKKLPTQQNVKIEDNNNSSSDQNKQLEKTLTEKNKIEVMPDIYGAQNGYKMPLITKDTLHQTTESIRKLMDASHVVSGIKTFSNQAPFNEIALQLMEPKLEKWINENLPELVEKIVREEIARIIPKHDDEKK